MLLALFLLLSLFTQLREIVNNGGTSDFSAYYGAYILKQNGDRPIFVLDERINNPEQNKLVKNLDGNLRNYLYPPIFAQVLSKFMPQDYKKARILWVILSHLSLLLLFITIQKLIYAQHNNKYQVLSLTLILFIVYSPIERELNYGQVSIMITALIWGGYYMLNTKKYMLSALLIAIASMMKVIPLFFLAIFALRKKYMAILYLLLTLAILYAASVILWGTTDWSSFYSLMKNNFIVKMSYDNSQPHSAIYQVPNYSITHLLYLLSDQMLWNWDASIISTWIRAITIAVSSAILLLFRNMFFNAAKDVRILGLGLSFICLIAPSLWNHYFVLLLPLYIILFSEKVMVHTFSRRTALLTISFFLTAMPDYLTNLSFTDNGILILLKFNKLYGLLILVCILIYDIYQKYNKLIQNDDGGIQSE